MNSESRFDDTSTSLGERFLINRTVASDEAPERRQVNFYSKSVGHDGTKATSVRSGLAQKEQKYIKGKRNTQTPYNSFQNAQKNGYNVRGIQAVCQSAGGIPSKLERRRSSY